MSNKFRSFEMDFLGKKLIVETGKMAPLAGGACLVKYGDTSVLCTATMSAKPREGMNFFPLSVDFEEKLYASGKIPGSFMKREGRPSEKAVLASRLVDRPIRPLFPQGMRNDVGVVMTVLSYDPEHPPEIAGMIGASIAISISEIPWGGPIAGVSIGLIDGELIFNPGEAQQNESEMLVTVSGTKEKVVMLEAGAKEVADEIVLDAILKGHEAMQDVLDFIIMIKKEIGKEKQEVATIAINPEFFEAVKAKYTEETKLAIDTDDKNVRDAGLKIISAKISEEYPDDDVDEAIYLLQKYIVRAWLLEGKRVDGRGMDEIRPLTAEVGLLPRTHGSGMFSRGQTQVLSIVTLGTMREAQLLDGLDSDTEKRYMHHYNFPSFSVGETRPNRGPGRRELGHGALAEKALLPVIPSVDDFPYSLRLVSEVLSSNGSTSQGAVCGCTLALMDAGVPIKAPVAGISCGLITNGDEFATMVDIQGIEDFYGDMDFKVAGTHKGITAIQLDIKNDGLTPAIITESIEKTKKGRLHILDDIMLKAIPAVRENLSQYAPKMHILRINPDKIREVIGSGGKVIQKLCADFDVKIDIEDDGSIFIAGMDEEKTQGAINAINMIVMDPEPGKTYDGTVTRLMNFGAFVEIAPGKEGLVHISKLAATRTEKVEDVVKTGDKVRVKVMEIDGQGRINLSIKDAAPKE